ncbi:putative leader peptide [Streptomyces massasporeus]
MGGEGAVREDEPRETPKRTPRRTEATDLTATFHAVHLHSRLHIDLQRVAAALCCS